MRTKGGENKSPGWTQRENTSHSVLAVRWFSWHCQDVLVSIQGTPVTGSGLSEQRRSTPQPRATTTTSERRLSTVGYLRSVVITLA